MNPPRVGIALRIVFGGLAGRTPHLSRLSESFLIAHFGAFVFLIVEKFVIEHDMLGRRLSAVMK